MTRLALGVLLAALALAIPASSASANGCHGTVQRHGGYVTLHASHLHTFGGMTCRRARELVGLYLRSELDDYEGCAVRSANGRFCQVGAYGCTKASPGHAYCRHYQRRRGVRFRERDESNA